MTAVRRGWALLGGVLIAASALLGRSAAAHPAPGSVAFLDFTVDGARLEQDVPLEELQLALHQQLVKPHESAAGAVSRQGALLSAYVVQHLRATSAATGQPWGVRLLDVGGHEASDGPRARFRFALSAPDHDAAASVVLHDDIVSHEVISHYTTVYVRSDWAGGAATGEPRLAGTIHAGRNDVTLGRQGSFAHGLKSVVALGIEHIVTGTDHLLFLFSLMLVVPVVAVGRAWRQSNDTRAALLAVARVVTAFTLGHSATLALGALGGLTIPSALVEAAIAASILITAAHALRPLFARREAFVAGAFGLVHGLAFASTLAGRDLGAVQAACTLLGFNLGIELAQLGLLALVVPWLLISARTRAYPWLRIGGATLAMVLAAGWLMARALGIANPVGRPLAWLEAHPLAPLLALVAFAAASRIAERLATREPEALSLLEVGLHRPDGPRYSRQATIRRGRLPMQHE